VVQLSRPITEEYFFGKLRGLYYDTAGDPVPRLLGALQQIADPTHILYGSAWPFTPEPVVANLAQKLAETSLLDAAARSQIYRENALTSFPRFKS
jgi:6-methylsalicylate decarboxylase